MILGGQDHATVFARLSAELLATPRGEQTAERLVHRTLDIIPGVDHASLTVPDRHAARTLAATSEVAIRCDSLQYQLNEGPCVEALADNDWYRSGDVGSDPRWPRWGPKAAAEGIGSLVAVRLAVAHKSMGALNLYSESPDQFGDWDTLDLVFLYALHAAVAFGTAKEITGLQTAMHNRHTVGVAQGILMQRYGLPLDRSFELLRRYSSSRNVKLRDIAAYVVEHHELPDTEAIVDDAGGAAD